MVYVPNPDDITNPTDGIGAESAQAEFRALKGKIAGLQGIITQWNSADKSAVAVLNAGNLVITNSSAVAANCSARTNTGIFAKSGYFEIKLTAAATFIYIGIAQISSNFITNNLPIGSDNISYAYRSDGTSWTNNVSTAFGSAAAVGDVIGVNYNALAGTLSFYKNGVLMGAGPAYSGIDTTKTWYPAITLVNANDSAIADFGTSAFAFTVPAGAQGITQPVVISSGIGNIVYNGRCEIDQQNLGAAQPAIATNSYMVDGLKYNATQAGKFNAQQNQGAVAPPPGYVNYQGLTVAVAYAPLAADNFTLSHPIEGWSIEHLDFGKATAKTITLSFLVYTSITGLHSGSIENAAANRSYPFQFLVSQANTWTQVAIVIPGDIAGVWSIQNTQSASIRWNLGSGANTLGPANAWAAANYGGVIGSVNIVATLGAVFYVTGIDLRAGVYGAGQVNERIPYPIELKRCYRYYKKYTSVQVPGAGTTTAFTFIEPMVAAPVVSGGGAGFVYTLESTFTLINFTQTTAGQQPLVFDARF